MAETWRVARLKVNIRYEDNIPVVEANGECDLVSSHRLKEAAESLFNTGRSQIVFDLRRMSYIDSSGFRVLLDAKKKASQNGGDIVLVSLTAPVERAFNLLRLHELITRTNTVEEAVEKLKGLKCV